MVENLHNDIDHPSSKSEILDEHFDEELNQEQIQELEQEREKGRRDQYKKANELAQQLNQNEIKKQNDIPQQTKDPSQENGKRKGNEKEITKYVEKLIKQNDFKGIFDYLGLDVKLLDTSNKVKTRDVLDKSLIKELELLSEPKDLRNFDKFLNNEDNILNETQEKYEDLYKKIMKIKEGNDDGQGPIFLDLLNKLFKQIRILNNNKISGFLYKSLMHKKIIRNIIEIKYVLKVKRKDFSKYLKRLNEYENGEYINFPNGITFELGKGPETIYGTNINIRENEFYIKTHIEKNGKNKKTKYSEYVDSLIKARELFEKKGIKLKYCKRHTRLANREFIKKYEEERKKRKEREGIKYEKSNRLKVLEQTENAVISYRHEKYGRSPIRFINKNEDRNLFEFAQNNDNFCEAEMWLDLDRLEIVNGLKEKNDYIIESYSIKDIINDGRIQPKDKIHTIINIIHNNIKNGDDHRKVTIDGKILPFSCGNKALLLQQIFKEYGNELGITESYIAQPNGHVMNIVKFNGDYCIVDSSDGAWFANIQKNIKIKHVGNINVFKLKSPLKNKHGEYNYTIFPIINLGNKTELYESVILEEYDLSVKEKMYQKASTNDYKELKAYVETLINSNELNPLNYFTGEEYLGIATNKEDIEYKKQIKELEYLMQDSSSLNEIQERRKILQTIKQDLGIDEHLIDKINNDQNFFNKISKSIAKIFKKSGY